MPGERSSSPSERRPTLSFKDIGTRSRLANTLRRQTMQNQTATNRARPTQPQQLPNDRTSHGGAVPRGNGGLHWRKSVLIESILSAPDHLSAVAANSMLLAMGAVLMLMHRRGDTLHGILMFPVLKPHSERVALGYFGARIIDAIFIAVGIMFLLLQIPRPRVPSRGSIRGLVPAGPEHAVPLRRICTPTSSA